MQVLEPFKEPIKVKMSSKPLETKITATIPNIVLFLSPTTVRLILHIINTLPTSDKVGVLFYYTTKIYNACSVRLCYTVLPHAIGQGG